MGLPPRRFQDLLYILDREWTSDAFASKVDLGRLLLRSTKAIRCAAHIFTCAAALVSHKDHAPPTSLPPPPPPPPLTCFIQGSEPPFYSSVTLTRILLTPNFVQSLRMFCEFLPQLIVTRGDGGCTPINRNLVPILGFRQTRTLFLRSVASKLS